MTENRQNFYIIGADKKLYVVQFYIDNSQVIKLKLLPAALINAIIQIGIQQQKFEKIIRVTLRCSLALLQSASCLPEFLL